MHGKEFHQKSCFMQSLLIVIQVQQRVILIIHVIRVAFFYCVSCKKAFHLIDHLMAALVRHVEQLWNVIFEKYGRF